MQVDRSGKPVRAPHLLQPQNRAPVRPVQCSNHQEIADLRRKLQDTCLISLEPNDRLWQRHAFDALGAQRDVDYRTLLVRLHPVRRGGVLTLSTRNASLRAHVPPILQASEPAVEKKAAVDRCLAAPRNKTSRKLLIAWQLRFPPYLMRP